LYRNTELSAYYVNIDPNLSEMHDVASLWYTTMESSTQIIILCLNIFIKKSQANFYFEEFNRITPDYFHTLLDK
jgi:hypothetical protein